MHTAFRKCCRKEASLNHNHYHSYHTPMAAASGPIVKHSRFVFVPLSYKTAARHKPRRCARGKKLNGQAAFLEAVGSSRDRRACSRSGTSYRLSRNVGGSRDSWSGQTDRSPPADRRVLALSLRCSVCVGQRGRYLDDRNLAALREVFLRLWCRDVNCYDRSWITEDVVTCHGCHLSPPGNYSCLQS